MISEVSQKEPCDNNKCTLTLIVLIATNVAITKSVHQCRSRHKSFFKYLEFQILFLEFRGFIISILLPETLFFSLFSLVESNKVNFQTLDQFPVYLTTKWRIRPICSIMTPKTKIFKDSEDKIDKGWKSTISGFKRFCQ